MSISLKDVKFLNKSFIGIIRDVDINLQIRGAKFFRQAVITRRFPRRWRRQAAGSQSTREAFQVLGLNTSGTWAVSLDQMAKKLTAAARGVTGERKRRWQKVVVAADDEPLSEATIMQRGLGTVSLMLGIKNAIGISVYQFLKGVRFFNRYFIFFSFFLQCTWN